MDKPSEVRELPAIGAMTDRERDRLEREIEAEGLIYGGVQVLGRDDPTSNARPEER